MRYGKTVNPVSGLRMMTALWIILGIILMPACSKTSEQAAPAGQQPAVTEMSEKKTATVPEQRQELLKQLQQLRGELVIMQGLTLKKYPALAQEQKALKTLIENKVEALMAEKGSDFQAFQALQRKLQNQDTPQEEKVRLMKDFQEQAKLAKKSRFEAMNDPEVQETYRQYEVHLKEKLIVDHPQALEKMEAFDQIQIRLQNIGKTGGAGAAPTR